MAISDSPGKEFFALRGCQLAPEVSGSWHRGGEPQQRSSCKLDDAIQMSWHGAASARSSCFSRQKRGEPSSLEHRLTSG